MKKLYTSIAAVVLAVMPSVSYAHNAPKVDSQGRYAKLVCEASPEDKFWEGVVLYNGTDKVPFGVEVTDFYKNKKEKIMYNANGQTVVTLEDNVTPTTSGNSGDEEKTDVRTFICPKNRTYCTTMYGFKVPFEYVERELASKAFSVLSKAIRYNRTEKLVQPEAKPVPKG